MTTRSRIVLAVHRLLLRTARPPLAALWDLLYRLLARGWAAYLVGGEAGASTYARGSIASAEAMPGLSDVDVAVVVDGRERAIERWQALRRRFPATDLLLDYPLILEPGDLHLAASGSVLTCAGTAYSGPRSTQDTVRLLERPGLYRAAADWELMRGPDRRPPEVERDTGDRRLAAWLELVSWWQWVFPVCADPRGPRTASLCVKLVAEPARIWLWLAHGERAASRTAALRRALELLPEEEQGLRLALELHGALRRSPEPRLAEVLPVLVGLSRRIASLIEADALVAGATEVRLAGAPADAPLPLCDWRGLVQPAGWEERFELAPGDPAAPNDVGRAAALAGQGPLPALRSGDLLVFAANRNRTRLRAVACPVTDPVSFALADGRPTAAFPELRGWSAADAARRAVAEHWHVLEGTESHGEELARVLGAARAAVFHDSLAAGEPLLPLTRAEAARRVGDEQAAAEFEAFLGSGARPAAATVAGLRAALRQLPAFAGARAVVALYE